MESLIWITSLVTKAKVAMAKVKWVVTLIVSAVEGGEARHSTTQEEPRMRH